MSSNRYSDAREFRGICHIGHELRRSSRSEVSFSVPVEQDTESVEMRLIMMGEKVTMPPPLIMPAMTKSSGFSSRWSSRSLTVMFRKKKARGSLSLFGCYVEDAFLFVRTGIFPTDAEENGTLQTDEKSKRVHRKRI